MLIDINIGSTVAYRACVRERVRVRRCLCIWLTAATAADAAVVVREGPNAKNWCC